MLINNVEFTERGQNFWVADKPLVVRDIVEFGSQPETIGKSALIMYEDDDIYVFAVCVTEDLNALQDLCKLSKEMKEDKGYTGLIVQHCLKKELTSGIVFDIDLD